MSPTEPVDERRLVILVNDDVRMTRGKQAAQAVHAALLALGVHPGCPVVVLNSTSTEIGRCQIQVRDAGLTELTPGTLTAGVAELHTGWARGHVPAEVSTEPPSEAVGVHLPSVVTTPFGTYVAVCSCGYQSRPHAQVAPGLAQLCRHIAARETEAV
jgi:PTH2 family peptidyl-tRNA hydrolase